jgi:hypothetical protein
VKLDRADETGVDKISIPRAKGHPERSRFSGGEKDLARIESVVRARSLRRLNYAVVRDDASE